MHRTHAHISFQAGFNFVLDGNPISLFIQDADGQQDNLFKLTEVVFFHALIIFSKCRNKNRARTNRSVFQKNLKISREMSVRIRSETFGHAWFKASENSDYFTTYNQ